MTEHEPTLRLVTKQAPVQPGDLQGGTLLCQLEFVRVIGSGGMGEVWEAKNADMPGERLAVKVVASEHACDPNVVGRFFGEARAAAAINDPNIVSIHGTGRTEDGRPALIMEFIDGQSLDDLCDAGPLPIDVVAKILLQIASALRAAHSCNIVHRDIKPANVMLTRRWGIECFVILVDFGIVKFRDAALAHEIHTNTNQYMGTVGYSAVEQLLARPVDAKADMYSLGVLAYRILCGREPYVAENAMEVMNLQLTDAPFFEPKVWRSDIPRVWNDLIMLCLQRDPRRRPNASEFARYVAAGTRNGASLLNSLAPRIAAETRVSSKDATISSDVPTALAQIQRMARNRGSRLATLAILLAGVCIGGVFVGAAVIVASRSNHETAASGQRTDANASLDDSTQSRSSHQEVPVLATPPVVAIPATPAADSVGKPLATPAKLSTTDSATGDTSGRDVAKARAPTPSEAAAPSARGAAKTTTATALRPAGTRGSLVLDAKTWADCYLVDSGTEEFLGTAPKTVELASGAHRVRCKNDTQHKDDTVTVTVSATKQAVVKNDW